MEEIIYLTNQYLAIGFLALCFIVIIVIIMLMLAMHKVDKLSKRIDTIMKGDKGNIESMLFVIHEDNQKLLGSVTDTQKRTSLLEEKIKRCLSKVSTIRYNPFEEMGGNLSFALAILDDNDDGVVINGIHNREGSYTYCKPLENGKSTYALSNEEKLAIERAMNNLVK